MWCRRPPLRIIGQRPAGAGIEASGIAVRRGQRLGDLRAGTEAGVDQALSLQLIERLCVERGALRLDDRLTVMIEVQPFQILVNAVDKLRAAATRVEVLDAQPELAAAGPRMSMAKRRRVSMAKVQPSRRRGGKTCDFQDSLHAKGDIGDS